VCLDPCLGYTERYLCVVLEMCRIDVLVLVLVLLWCWKLRVALARSCIVTGDHCRIGVLSVVIVIVVIDSACGTDSLVLYATWFQEHKNAFRTANNSSNFAKHLIEHTHSFGPHPQLYANITTTKQSSTFKHYRTILHLCRTH